MKKLSVILSAALLLAFAVSCNKAAQVEEPQECVVNVSFGVEDGAATRADFGTGSGATVLEYRVYVQQGSAWKLTNLKAKLTDVTYPKEISLRLANNMTYRIVCFAQSPAAAEASLYDLTDFDDISVAYDALLPNNDMGDAFCANRQFVAGATTSLTVVMHRPLSQINVFSGDMADFNASSVDNPLKSITLAFHDVPNKFGLVLGDANAEGYVPARVKDGAVQDVTFTCDVLSGAVRTFGGIQYSQFSMNYLLAAPAVDLTTVDLTLKAQDGTVVTNVQGISNVPYQSNYRTNIYGNLITNAVNFTIDLDPEFYEPDYEVQY